MITTIIQIWSPVSIEYDIHRVYNIRKKLAKRPETSLLAKYKCALVAKTQKA